MAFLQITGGIPLHGQVACSGAKNAALPIMAAAVLASEPVRLQNVPRLTDVDTLADVLRAIGLEVVADPNSDCLMLQTVDSQPTCAPEHLVRQMRASFCVLGPLLARRGHAIVPLPGGCNIGNRPVDLHLKGLAALGADLRLEHGYVVASAHRLQGAVIDLAGPFGSTVTGTANLMSAATLARGTTVLHHAACEPEIVDLGRFLMALGAKIEGLGTSCIRIEGVEELGGAHWTLLPDRIEAATLLLAGAITGGNITVTHVVPEHLGAVLAALSAAGAATVIANDSISVVAADRLQAVNVVARPYPEMPTDVQAQWTALMATADGKSTIRDCVFPSRFQHVPELNRLGANTCCTGDSVAITGVRKLEGAHVTACDLRASAALVLAGLAAEGRTTIDAVEHLDRGYERLDSKLCKLGAQIERSTHHTANKQIPKEFMQCIKHTPHPLQHN